MTTPTREQVIEWAKEAGFTQYEAEAAFDCMSSLAALAMSAGREQGLREAKEVCIHINAPDGTNAQAWECAAAIEQLRGK